MPDLDLERSSLGGLGRPLTAAQATFGSTSVGSGYQSRTYQYECPVEAIYAEDDVPADQVDFVPLNAQLAVQWKPTIERKPGLPDADDRATTKDKRGELDRG